MLEPATFLERQGRFVARVRLADGRLGAVHIASSGRMAELLVPGAEVLVKLNPNPGNDQPDRKTVGLLSFVRAEHGWVSVDTAAPGRLLRHALAAGDLPPFAGYAAVKPEHTYGDSRIDFLLTGPDRPPCLLEVKSVTSVLPDPDGARVARFPDAPTQRGARHLHELLKATGEGYRAAVLFVVQREDAEAFGPWDQIDPAFGNVLREVAARGVEVHAWALTGLPDKVRTGRSLPVRLGE